MSINKVYLLLGSNINDRKKYLKDAQTLISQRVGKVVGRSEMIETEPIGFETEHQFLNQVLKVETELSPMQLLDITQEVEKILGRIEKTKNDKYHDRTIDIDILKFGNLHYNSKRLKIPHIENMENRLFVKELINKVL